MAVNKPESPASDMLVLEANRKIFVEDIATDVTFLNRTALLILAEDWFGKLVEKFLKVCNR